MSSTSNVQSVLTSVLRPVYTYASSNFSTQLVISNVNTVSANVVKALRADVYDAACNVYMGYQAGNPISTLQSCSNNTAIGALAGSNISSSTNLVAIGLGAGAASYGSTNCIFIGTAAGLGSISCANNIVIDPSGSTLISTSVSNTIALGSSMGVQGSGNILIGNGNGQGLTGGCNMMIGTGVSSNVSATTSNLMLIGSGSNVLIAGNLSNKTVAIGKADATMQYLLGGGTVPGLTLDVAGYTRIQNGLAIGIDPLQYNLDVNGVARVSDGYGTMTFSNGALSLTNLTNSSTGALTTTGNDLYWNGTLLGSGGGGGGGVESVTAGTNITITGTGTNPIINAGGGGTTPASVLSEPIIGGDIENPTTTQVNITSLIPSLNVFTNPNGDGDVQYTNCTGRLTFFFDLSKITNQPIGNNVIQIMWSSNSGATTGPVLFNVNGEGTLGTQLIVGDLGTQFLLTGVVSTPINLRNARFPGGNSLYLIVKWVSCVDNTIPVVIEFLIDGTQYQTPPYVENP